MRGFKLPIENEKLLRDEKKSLRDVIDWFLWAGKQQLISKVYVSESGGASFVGKTLQSLSIL